MSELNIIPFLNLSDKTPVLSRFIHESIDELLGKLSLNYQAYTNEIEWTSDEFQRAKKDIQDFYCENVTQETKPSIKDVTSDVNEIIHNCFTARKDEILQHLIRESIVNGGHNLVENFDWRLKWIMGSSTLATIREPLLQLDLHTVKLNQGKNQMEKCTVNCEMTLEQLDNLIKDLTVVQKNLDIT